MQLIGHMGKPIYFLRHPAMHVCANTVLIDLKWQCRYLILLSLFIFRLSCPNLDIDECSIGTNDCHMNATCTNEEGSYLCSCYEGFNDTSFEGYPGRNCTGNNQFGIYSQCW